MPRRYVRPHGDGVGVKIGNRRLRCLAHAAEYCRNIILLRIHVCLRSRNIVFHSSAGTCLQVEIKVFGAFICGIKCKVHRMVVVAGGAQVAKRHITFHLLRILLHTKGDILLFQRKNSFTRTGGHEIVRKHFHIFICRPAKVRVLFCLIVGIERENHSKWVIISRSDACRGDGTALNADVCSQKAACRRFHAGEFDLVVPFGIRRYKPEIPVIAR